MSKEYFSFKWDNFENCLYRSFTNEIIDRAKYADVTLVCDDKVSIEAHKLILSRSPLLKNFLLVNPHPHPLIFLTGIHHAEMEAILNIMYQGEAMVRRNNLQAFWAAVHDLQIDKIRPRSEQKVEKMVDCDKDMIDVHDGQRSNFGNNIADLDKDKQNIQYECNVCDYKVATWRYLKLHHESKHEGIRYPCKQCSYEATTQGDLKRHTQSVHEGVKYSCDNCHYLATTRGDLLKHNRSLHEGVRYPCDKCKYKATQKSSLVNHKISVHIGQRFHCSECDFQSGYKSSLQKHQKRIHVNFISLKSIAS